MSEGKKAHERKDERQGGSKGVKTAEGREREDRLRRSYISNPKWHNSKNNVHYILDM